MALTTETKLRRHFAVSGDELNEIKCFIQGAVYCWAKNQKGEVFTVRSLMGGENFDWKGTPLYCLYQKQIKSGKSDKMAISEAGKELGGILKTVLSEDKRLFKSYDAGRAKGYKWVNQL